MNSRNGYRRDLLLVAALGLCGGLFAPSAYSQQTASGVGARTVSVAPQRLPIWGPFRQGEAGQAQTSPQTADSAGTGSSGMTSATGDSSGASGAGVVAPVAPKVGGLLDHCPVNHGPIPEPIVTEGPGDDLVVVLPPAQQGLPLDQPGLPLAQPCRPTLWLDASYLMWWVEGSRTPALVTSGTGGSTGILGEAGTEVLYPTTMLNSDMRMGVRANGGFWFDDAGEIGIEADYLYLFKETEQFSVSGDGHPVLARPFFDIVAGAEDSHVFAFPNVALGSIDITADSRLHGGGLWFRKALVATNDNRAGGYDYAGTRVDFLAGYRFMQLDEGLRINESYETAGPTQIALYDSFAAENTFHGANLGLVAEVRRWALSLELLMQLALGHSSSKVTIDGQTTTTAGGVPVVSDGGLLALTTNSGSYTQNELAAIPELGVTVGCNITERLRATVGYTFIYWSRVARPGEQIDRNLNPTYFPNNGPAAGAPQPEFDFVTSDMWIQGVNFGLDYRY